MVSNANAKDIRFDQYRPKCFKTAEIKCVFVCCLNNNPHNAT